MDLNVLVFLFAHYMPLSTSPKGCNGTKRQCKKVASIDVAALAILYHAHLFVNVFIISATTHILREQMMNLRLSINEK